MDDQIEGFSKVIPVRMNKDGNVSKGSSKVVDPEQYETSPILCT